MNLDQTAPTLGILFAIYMLTKNLGRYEEQTTKVSSHWQAKS